MPEKSDILARVVLKTPAIRMAICRFRELATEGLRRHDADPVAGRLLSGLLGTGALMSVLLDEEESFAIRIDYDGPVGGLLADVRADGRIRGLVKNPHVMAEGADSIEVACGHGSRVAVTRSNKAGRILNSGEVKTAFIMPPAALGFFLSTSDQIESEILAEVVYQADPENPVAHAGGVLIQAMPGCDLEEFDGIRNRLLSNKAWDLMRDSSSDLEEKLRLLLRILLAKIDLPEYTVHLEEAPHFWCNCSAERMNEMARKTLGEEDYAKLFEENPEPAVDCHFCGNRYLLKR